MKLIIRQTTIIQDWQTIEPWKSQHVIPEQKQSRIDCFFPSLCPPVTHRKNFMWSVYRVSATRGAPPPHNLHPTYKPTPTCKSHHLSLPVQCQFTVSTRLCNFKEEDEEANYGTLSITAALKRDIFPWRRLCVLGIYEIQPSLCKGSTVRPVHLYDHRHPGAPVRRASQSQNKSLRLPTITVMRPFALVSTAFLLLHISSGSAEAHR